MARDGDMSAANAQAPPTPSEASMDPATTQLSPRQALLNATPQEIAVSGILMGLAPSHNVLAQTDVNSGVTTDDAESLTILSAQHQTHAQLVIDDGDETVSQPDPDNGPSTISRDKKPATGTKRKRQTRTASTSQAESGKAQSQKRSRAAKKNVSPDAGSSTIAVHSSSSFPLPPDSLAARNPKFNIFEALINHPDLVYHFAVSFDIDDLISIYAISKDFHEIVNSKFTAVIAAMAMIHAPTSAKIFPFRCYRKLCIPDPSSAADQSQGRPRLVPSFRWLRMICFREEIAKRIRQIMTNEGLYLPWQCEEALKKMWFLMDIPDNHRRLGTVQNPQLWTTEDLFYAVMFLVRFDMRCTDPLATQSHGGMRRLLMAQPTMSLLYRTLNRTAMRSSFEVIQAFLRWKYVPRVSAGGPIYGVPHAQIGRLQYEGYGAGDSQIKLQRPDELVLKECIRRDMDIWEYLMEIIVWRPNHRM